MIRTKMILCIRILCILIILACVFYIHIQAQEAKIEKEGSLTIVKNPKHPVKKAGSLSTLVLIQDLCIGDSVDDENYMFSTIGGVKVDGEEDIIVIDEKEVVIKVYDKTGKHIRTFGKRGQGPGEFQSAARIELRGGKDIVILDNRNNRFSYYSKEGQCLKEIKLGKHTSIRRVKVDSRGYIYTDTLIIDKGKVIEEIKRFDPEFKEFEIIAKNERIRNYTKFNPISEWFMYAVMDDDRFILGRNTKYEFSILDLNMKPIKKIIKDYDPVKITKEAQEIIISRQFGDRGVPDFIKLAFPKNFTPWYYFICDDIGRFYVRTFKENNKGELKWDVFDEEGLYILSFYLSIDEYLYCIRNNKAYTFINENEEGIPVVLRYKMDWR